MKMWEIIWIGILAAVAILDFVLDKINVKYTLSYQVWQAEDIARPGEWTFTRYFILGLLIWAILHLVFKKVT